MAINPLPPSVSFIGRHGEQAEIVRLLADPACRLLTLVGPGGIGKTRLALEATHSDSPRSEGEGVRVHFIPLQPLTSPDFIVPAIAECVGFQFDGSDTRQQLLDYLCEKSLLLVLDNFEHLLDGVGVVSDILAAAPRVKMLVTSRERLNLLEEWVLELQGLRFPENDSELEIEGYSAVQLFLQNARRVQVSFNASAAQKPAIIRICRMVGGMPLGIELAAAWVRALSVEQIASELERGLDILESSARNVEQRHRNMRAVIEHSWNLLSPEEQKAYRKLAVFCGSFTLEAAQAVSGASVWLLTALVDKSLLRADETGHYNIHELLRQYAEEQLEYAGESDSTRDSHADYYAAFLDQREVDLKGRRQLEALDEIEADFDNVRAAWYWAVSRQHAESINRAVESLKLFGDMRGRYYECEEMFRQAQQAFTSDRRTWGRITARRAWIVLLGYMTTTPIEDWKSLLEQCLAIARDHEDRAEAAFCLYCLGIEATPRSADAGLPLFEESLALYRELNDVYGEVDVTDWVALWQPDTHNSLQILQGTLAQRRQIGAINLVGWTLFNIGTMKMDAGQLDEAEIAFQESLTIQQQRGDRKGILSHMYRIGEVALFAGDFHKARALAEDILKLSEEYNLFDKKAGLALQCILSAIADGDYPRARQHGEAALTMPKSLGYLMFAAPSLMGLAVADIGIGDFHAARQHIHSLLSLAVGLLSVSFIVLALPVLAMIRAHEDASPQAAELLGLAFSAWPHSGWMEKWPMLTEFRAKLDAELGASAYAAAWERGTTLDILETAKALVAEHTAAQPENGTHVESAALTGRELEILHLIASGLSNRDIAEQLVFSVGTVKWYVNQIFSKLHVGSRTQAVARARELHLLS
jgi:predicted ATPase/DNA-binding CsgD family transcriptional regulator